MNDFHYAMFQANLLYGIDIEESDFEELGLNAWNAIGNKHVKLYKFTGDINPKTLTLTLPCNANIIEAVTTNKEDWNYTTNKHISGDINSSVIEEFIEGSKIDKNPLYISGKYINFEQQDNILYFDKNYGTVNVLYKGVLLDDLGLPKINDKETQAIAVYVAYVLKFKEGLITNNSQIILMAALLRTEWDRKCDAARVPEYINLNDMNDILDAKTSWNRKIYNKSYKPLK